MADEASQPLRVFLFPLMSPGHMIPMIDIAKLFARHGAAVTVVTTPGNEPLVRPAIDCRHDGTPVVDLLLLPFPDSVAHLVPSTGEHLGAITTAEHADFMAAVFALAGPLDDLLRQHRPDCLVSDAMFPWTSATAAQLGIPRLVFYGPGAFPLCVHRSIEFRGHHAAASSRSEPFAIEGLPHRIHLAPSEISPIFNFTEMVLQQRKAEENSFGVIVNSFYELEPVYADLFRKEPVTKAYYVGPVALCDQEKEAQRGSRSSPELGRWLSWLDSKPAGAVVYVCFGSLCELSKNQFKDLALGLEASGHPFLWVVREVAGGPPACESEWLPDGYERRVEGRGLVIRGWAPQVALLGHPAVGGFVTHCGWNSTLEGLTAGKPMAAWPLNYEQFVNEKLLTEVAGVGVRVRWSEAVGAARVTAEEVAAAVRELMGAGEGAAERRHRAREYAGMAKAAMKEGGSSDQDMKCLMEELMACKTGGAVNGHVTQ
ncbi:hypothetical protein BHE74_00034325 [Ensete ventricosum]|nr:hypothetical protein BHE74_00034325 [Ensete ventricosum]